MGEELIPVQIENDKHIALWKYSPENSIEDKNILMTHGTFSNRKVLKGIVQYLVANEFTCWVFEWRSHGESSKVSTDFNYETVGREDFKLVFSYLFEQQKIKRLHCVTHSAGGFCLAMALVNYPLYQSKIDSISMFGCQVFGAGLTWSNYLKILIGKYTSKLLGTVPARKTGSEENESYFLMKQWYDWNLNENFIGNTGIDYKKELKNIRIPILAFYGGSDHFIAPPKACKAFLDLFENPVNKGFLCSKDEGYLENYNHSRLMLSSNAKKELYPIVLDWINQYLINENEELRFL